MRRKINFKQYRHALILFILTGFIILLFLPRAGKFKYEFQTGKPWSHENLTAPFNFPIYKSSAELSEERKQIMNNYNAYYSYDSLIGHTQINLLKNELLKEIEWVPIKDYLINTFNQIYTRGILNDKANTPITSVIFIVKGNLSEDYPINDIFTLSSAHEYVTKSLRQILKKDDLNRLLHDIDLNKYLKSNLLYDSKLTQQVQDNRLNAILPTQGMVIKGDKIISKGEMVTPSTYQILSSLKKEHEENIGFSGSWLLLIIGQLLYVLACLTGMFTLLLLFRHEILSQKKHVLFLIILINVISIVTLLVARQNENYIYIIPYTIVPIYIATFFYSRPALLTHWMLILMLGNFVPNSFEFVFLNSIAGVFAIWGFKHLYKRGQLFFAVLLIFTAYSTSYIILKLIQEGSLGSINWFFLAIFAVNSLLIITLYQFTFIFEKLFGFLSDLRLIELADTNQKLLRKLAEVAPGTFQHSLQVANLAEAAIREIGGNALLVRTGALYHDIGKIKEPVFFIENQSSGYNPHDGLTPEESAKIIIEHVTNGIELAHKHNLPEAIIDFIRSHHATSKVYYFYSQYKALHPEAKESEITPLFTYPGMCPRSKEMAVVMVADATEAASRSLKEISVETISNLVDKLVSYKLTEGYFDEADITMAELLVVKEVIKQKLQNIYHSRIEYPEMKSEKR